MLSTRDKGGAQHRARCQEHLRAGDSKLLESLTHPKEAALGKDMEEAQGITGSRVQEHWGGRVGLIFSQPFCEPGEQGSTGMCGNRKTLGQGSSAALLLIQTQIQNKTLGKTSKGKGLL